MKRIIALILALVLISSLILSFTACDEEEKGGKRASNTKKEEEYIEGDIFSERAQVDDGLGEYDFGGKSLRFVSYDAGRIVPNAEKNSGNLIPDAIWERNAAVENRFNMKVEIAYEGMYGEVNNWVSKSVLSGADEFDVYMSHVHTAGTDLAIKNIFINWYDVPNIDFTKPWWAKSNVEELTYDGKCILAISDMNYLSIFLTPCIFFNKALANSYDLGNLYEVVLDGDWTMDYMLDLVKDVYQDLDGSGTRTPEDFYGCFASTTGWLWAFNNPIIRNNEEGVPTIVLKTDKLGNIVNKVYELCYDTRGAYYNPSEKGSNAMADNPFVQGREILSFETLNSALYPEVRNFEDDYGILPMPKLDENQKGYHSMPRADYTVMGIPKTVKSDNLEFVGTCVEALAAESYKKVVPTYYEIALKTRYLRDNESKDVLDVIIEGRLFDFAYVYNASGEYCNIIDNLMKKGNKNYESYYQSKYNLERLQLKKILKTFEKLS